MSAGDRLMESARRTGEGMTARCYPADPDFESAAERVVWEALRDQLPDDAALR